MKNVKVPTLSKFIATWSRTRHYGYTVQDVTSKTAYFLGANCTGGWYKYKKDAQKVADVINAMERGTI